jgi:glyoxylase-like metal-dependent hydrolase (beta-lactamase superfamily II)
VSLSPILERRRNSYASSQSQIYSANLNLGKTLNAQAMALRVHQQLVVRCRMQVTRLEQSIFLVDVEPGSLENFIATYVLKGKHVAIIETGPTSSVPNLLSGLEKLDIKLEDVVYVAVTHIHLDHGGGVGTLIRNLPRAKVIVHHAAASHLQNPQKLWQQSNEVLGKEIAELYQAPEPVPAGRIIAATDGMTFDIGNKVRFRVVETLGHASHHQSYYETFSEGLFPGDAAGIYLKDVDVVVPTTPPPFHLDASLASLNRLIDLNPKALYYSHFGRATNAVERLRAYADELKLWVSITEQGLRNKQGFEDIRDKILESDESVRRAVQFVKSHPVLGGVVFEHSIEGVVKFVEKQSNIAEK